MTDSLHALLAQDESTGGDDATGDDSAKDKVRITKTGSMTPPKRPKR